MVGGAGSTGPSAGSPGVQQQPQQSPPTQQPSAPSGGGGNSGSGSGHSPVPRPQARLASACASLTGSPPLLLRFSSKKVEVLRRAGRAQLLTAPGLGVSVRLVKGPRASLATKQLLLAFGPNKLAVAAGKHGLSVQLNGAALMPGDSVTTATATAKAAGVNASLNRAGRRLVVSLPARSGTALTLTVTLGPAGGALNVHVVLSEEPGFKRPTLGGLMGQGGAAAVRRSGLQQP